MDICDDINNKEKEKIKYLDKIDKTQLNNLTLELIRRNFVSLDSLDIVRYDTFFNEIVGEYDYYTILVAVNYVISRMKDKVLDEEGQPILQTFSYFKTSLLDNLEKLTSNHDNSFESIW